MRRAAIAWTIRPRRQEDGCERRSESGNDTPWATVAGDARGTEPSMNGTVTGRTCVSP